VDCLLRYLPRALKHLLQGKISITFDDIFNAYTTNIELIKEKDFCRNPTFSKI